MSVKAPSIEFRRHTAPGRGTPGVGLIVGSGHGRRYSMVVVARAKEHISAGWSAWRTCQLLEQEFGVRPNVTTVRTWTDKQYARVFAAKNRRSSQRAHERGVGRRPLTRTTPAWRLARMRELRDAGLSFLAISQVARVWWGEIVSDDTVRARLGGGERRRAYRRAA